MIHELCRPVSIPDDRTRRFRVLSLGAGVQSSTVYLMALAGDIPPIDCAVFADVGEEPKIVYDYLDYLRSLNGPPIHTVSVGTRLGDDLMRGVNSTKQRFVSIPAYTGVDGSVGITRRQCTAEYKIAPIDRFVRRDLLGLRPRSRVPKNTHVTKLIGISLDEVRRAIAISERCDSDWQTPEFPLLIAGMTRKQCVRYIEQRGHPTLPRSACVFCPYKSDREWLRLKTEDSDGWERAVKIDEALRRPGNVVNRNMRSTMWLHRSLTPIAEINFESRIKSEPVDMQLGLWSECEGMCGL